LTGRGGASIYGKQFDDEITDDLKHTGQCNSVYSTFVLTEKWYFCQRVHESLIYDLSTVGLVALV